MHEMTLYLMSMEVRRGLKSILSIHTSDDTKFTNITIWHWLNLFFFTRTAFSNK